MSVDEVRVRLRQKFEDSFGAEEASLLMDRPPGGWNDLVTNTVLDAKFEAVDARFEAVDARFEALDAKLDAMESRLRADIRTEVRDQTRWLATLVVAAQGMVVAAMATVGAILRFV